MGGGDSYELEGGISWRRLTNCYNYFKKHSSRRGKIAHISNVEKIDRKKIFLRDSPVLARDFQRANADVGTEL